MKFKIIDKLIKVTLKQSKNSLHSTSFRGTYQPDLEELKNNLENHGHIKKSL